MPAPKAPPQPAGTDFGLMVLPVDRIQIDPDNVRTNYDPDMIEGLRELLRDGGQFVNAPHVYPIGGGRYRVKHGNTRLLAAQGVVAELPVRVVPAPESPQERVLSQLSENL